MDQDCWYAQTSLFQSNPTLVQVKELYETYVKCTILSGSNKSREVLICRMKLSVGDENPKRPRYTRTQFPFRPAYCLTINKVCVLLTSLFTSLIQAQGQTFERVGVILSNNVFAHGQLYVALSRARNFGCLKIFSGAELENVGRVIWNNVHHGMLRRLEDVGL